MKSIRMVFIFSLALMILSGCEKELIQPDTLNASDEMTFKGAKAKMDKKMDHFVPFKGSFDVFSKRPPIIIDGYKDYLTGAMGKVSHLGKTMVTLEQKWWPIDGNPFVNPDFTNKIPPALVDQMPEVIIPADDPFVSYYPSASAIQWWGMGTGDITFVAANGDLLLSKYFAFSYHPDENIAIIYTIGWFVEGEDGRFADAEGDFIWTGVFNKTGPNAGKGEASATGMIKY